MKNAFFLLLLAGLLTGCGHHYDMTLTNGMMVTGVSRPVLDKEAGAYVYSDVTGRKHSISASQVVEIQPHRASQFSPGTKQ